MQFTLSEDCQEVATLARQVFSDYADQDRLRTVEADGGLDEQLWAVLAEAGLLGIGTPEDDGGSGLGLEGLVALLAEQGRWLGSVPIWALTAGAALPLARFGTAEQKAAWLEPLLAGEKLVVGAFDATGGLPARLTATVDGDGWVLSGSIESVNLGQRADALLVPATMSDQSVAVFIVGLDDVTATPLLATSWETMARVEFDRVAVGPADVLAGTDVAGWARRRCRVALAALASGVCAAVVEQTAAYTSQREQFGRPLSTNQAVTFRMADAYLDCEQIKLTTYRAASLLDAGDEVAGDTAALVAKWWVGKGAPRITEAAQQLHGGLGADIEYPIHRYYLWARQAAYTLGGAKNMEAELGSVLAARRPRLGAAE